MQRWHEKYWGRDDILIAATGAYNMPEGARNAYLIYGQTGRKELYDTIDLAAVGRTTGYGIEGAVANERPATGGRGPERGAAGARFYDR